MKKGTLLNSEVSHLISRLGHTDEITISDAGLPVPDNVQRIDLALCHGVPDFIRTVQTIMTEMKVEAIVLAREFKEVSPEHHELLMNVIDSEEKRTGEAIDISYVSHEEFKQLTQSSKAIVRTGEFTAYANVIFKSGVVF
ncbi:D-ribose pyranase [Vibrio salinus]|uniref:D-ribose pyranase n=1 Tax=Vibrio salinus TaxID=2899784 RepID=UPI001E3E7479|nr:D-ribose pyranase [Vibrio salinus]MCE0495042.1 D-ribose pyranase [Vibrio salinus]